MLSTETSCLPYQGLQTRLHYVISVRGSVRLPLLHVAMTIVAAYYSSIPLLV